MYFTYDGLSLSTPSIVIRFGWLVSFQVTSTAARPLGAQATATSLGAGSEAHAVSEVAPTTTASATASIRRTRTTSSQLPHCAGVTTEPREPYPVRSTGPPSP